MTTRTVRLAYGDTGLDLTQHSEVGYSLDRV